MLFFFFSKHSPNCFTQLVQFSMQIFCSVYYIFIYSHYFDFTQIAKHMTNVAGALCIFFPCPSTYQISVCRCALHLQRFNLHLGQRRPSAVHTVLSVSQWMVPNSRLYKPMGEMIFLLSTPRIEACKLLQASFSLSKLPWQGNEQVDSALAYLWESCTLKGL